MTDKTKRKTRAEQVTPLDVRIRNPRERVFLPELLAEVSRVKEHARKIELLRMYANKNEEHFKLIRDFLQCVYHPAVVFDLPEGAPPYTSDYVDYTLAPMSLREAFTRVPYFVKGHSKYIENPIKRERVFVQTLEGMYKDDCVLFLMVKEKKFDSRKYKTLNEAIFREAFPDIMPQQESK